MSETINNYQFDLAYEDYKAYVQCLKTVYHRLIFNFSTHHSVLFWQKRNEYWRNYPTLELGYAAFDSIESLEAEISKIHPEYALSRDFEEELIQNKKA